MRESRHVRTTQMSDIYFSKQGQSPLVISMPHSGIMVPPNIRERFTPEGALLADTDWHQPKLYDFVLETPASVVIAKYSRYVVDLNRDPQGVALYAGADNTALCPTTTFSREAIYREGAAPCAEEVQERIATFWAPYHDALKERILEAVKTWGYAVLFDAHSIRGVVPRFFDGKLPDFNVGTNDGASASGSLATALVGALRQHERFTTVLNGRFKGGYITRHYGRPEDGVHAVQLEMVQDNYMDEAPPFDFGSEQRTLVQGALGDWVNTLLGWSPQT